MVSTKTVTQWLRLARSGWGLIIGPFSDKSDKCAYHSRNASRLISETHTEAQILFLTASSLQPWTYAVWDRQHSNPACSLPSVCRLIRSSEQHLTKSQINSHVMITQSET